MRLCVVAPTVNVSFGAQVTQLEPYPYPYPYPYLYPTVNVSFGAQVAACKAPLPQGKIKDVLETQVRARYRDGVRVRVRSWTPSTRRSPERYPLPQPYPYPYP